MMIDCRLGPVKDGITRVMLQVIECPKSARLGDVVVAVGDSHGHFTPCRHDGTLETEEVAA